MEHKCCKTEVEMLFSKGDVLFGHNSPIHASRAMQILTDPTRAETKRGQ